MSKNESPGEEQVQEPVENQAAAATLAQGNDVEQFRELTRKFGPSIGIGFTLAIALVVAMGVTSRSKTAKINRAAEALTTAASSDDYRQVQSLFSETPSGQVAALGLGALLYEEGKYEEARDTYAAFVSRNPGHPMIPSAILCQAQCLEAAGQLEEALQAFRAFQTSHMGHFLNPFSQLSASRCLEQLQRWDEARVQYEDLIVAHPNSPWSQAANNGLVHTRRKLRATQSL